MFGEHDDDDDDDDEQYHFWMEEDGIWSNRSNGIS